MNQNDHTTGSEHDINEHGQPVGLMVDGWSIPPPPARTPMTGRFVSLVPIDVDEHAPALFAAFDDPAGWTYLKHGPFDDGDTFTQWMRAACTSSDPLFHTIIVDDRAVGLASFLRIDPAAGSIEVGYLHFAPALQRTPASTEAMFLMMHRAFQLGFRRYEWKCDALNAPSRATALRLGFTFEGMFRQATIVKGRNRDTAWFSVTDTEWPAIRTEFERWLDPSNFDAAGRQLSRLDTRR